MKKIRKILKFTAIFFAIHMLTLSGPYQSAWAAMLSTESIIHIYRGQSPRNHFNSFLARAEIQAVLISYGIDPQEARNRIDNLSDDEIAKFVHEIDQLPAGGGGSVGVVTFFIICIILMLTDIFFNNPTPDN